MMQYTILEEADTGELATEVQDHMTRGWEPLGGVAMLRYEWPEKDGLDCAWVFAQAMVRKL